MLTLLVPTSFLSLTRARLSTKTMKFALGFQGNYFNYLLDQLLNVLRKHVRGMPGDIKDSACHDVDFQISNLQQVVC